MKIKPESTYIEKPQYYEQNRVLVVSAVRDTVITGYYQNMESWKISPVHISRSEFMKRFELSPIQIR